MRQSAQILTTTLSQDDLEKMVQTTTRCDSVGYCLCQAGSLNAEKLRKLTEAEKQLYDARVQQDKVECGYRVNCTRSMLLRSI